VIRRADGSEWDIGGEWRSLGVHEAISLAAGEEITPDTELPVLLRLCEQLDVPLQPSWNRGQVILEMYERLVEKQTVEPTFYRDFPVEVSPLTRQHRSDPRLAERWDLVSFGTELGTGYSELVDPVVQRERLTAQSLLAAGGDPEAMELDEDFLLALEYAMPPTGGMGMGLDRLMIMLTGENIRETILFPFVRPGA
jgi:lysyl-tRNA synthetase class 2